MIKTRFAPSPTGFVHIGNLRTALYAYLFAKQQKGHLILRIEDTDQERFVEGAMESLINTLKWAGLSYDEGPHPDDLTQSIGEAGPYIQSQRLEIYKEEVQKLLETGHAYHCFCSLERLDQMRKDQQERHLAPMYDKKCRYRPKEEIKQLLEEKAPYVIRLAIPEHDTLRFRDLVRGDLQFESATIDDQVLVKSDGFPTYHLANVVDDHLMKVTHVIRGEEWLPSTPKHVYLYKAFNWERPEFAHIPLFLNKDKSKLSKRQNDVAVEDYIKKGYLPEAMLNFIALLGWNPGAGETNEIFSLDQLVEKFNLGKVHKAGAVFDLERLNWFNAHYIRALSVEEFAGKIYPWLEKTDWFKGTADDLQKKEVYRLLPAIQTRITILSEAPAILNYLLAEKLEYNPSLLKNEKMNVDLPVAKSALQACYEDLKKHDDFSSEDAIKACLVKTIDRLKFKNGQVLWPLRVALSGQEYSPGAFEMIFLLGKEKSLERIGKTNSSLAATPANL
ncbi:MAG: Glutamyl/glutaminyl-tRNA synthetase, glutamyl-tRNA synthetase [Candidatus Peregrinibacteria bacterium GW2011_GWE2_39_6]|nr:MAG: Glutamyl/glutaminyl-tRNA synthetase, glutamyl-tRNA synthetase [Candidatus Peregrinibacteria bacterium GW2011_GWF2_39_17]KKR24115.1 MAG: Glutamyl/glutaminyl-tRNA synthetase, glutamyl-tRNA synthetase [Candidatus Peregrinibacteria bacterium GW2011_GWE2_39_6]HCW32770.1 glutamate--tRNA ligase [Candidatus Peregrinibacteria bacterium]